MAIILPIFDVGEIIDLRHENMPDRIQICMVYKKMKSVDWMYYVLSEQANGMVYMSQNQIFTRQTKHRSGAYKDSVVRQLLGMGYRFVCNKSKMVHPNDMIQSLCNKNEIAEVITMNAIYPDGSHDTNGNDVGIWIKYRTVIDTMCHGSIMQNITRIK